MLGFDAIAEDSIADVPDGGAAGHLRRFVKTAASPPFVGKVVRRDQEADAAAGKRITRRTSRPEPLPPRIDGSVDRRSWHADVAGTPVSIRLFTKQPKAPPPNSQGSVSRRGAMPNAAGKEVDNFRRVSSPPIAPRFKGKAKHYRGAKDSPPPPPNTSLVHNIKRFIRQAPFPKFDGDVQHKPKKLHYDAPGPTELFYLQHFIEAPKLPPQVLKGKTTRRKGHAPNNNVPRNIPTWTRRHPAPKQPKDTLKGKVVRRKGHSPNIVPAPFDPIKLLRRCLKQKRPSPTALQGHVHRRFGIPTPTWFDFQQVFLQSFRVADDSKAVYELFVGINGPPNFAAPPQATSASLPISWAPTGSGTRVLHIVVRLRNKYDLESFNVFEQVRTINGAGAEQPTAVAAPLDVKLYDAETSYATVMAKYNKSDDPTPADTWDIYVKVGSIPVIGTDPLTLSIPMTFAGIEAGLLTEVGPYAPGSVLWVIVVTRQSVSGASTAAAPETITLAEPLDLTDGSIFGGAAFEQL